MAPEIAITDMQRVKWQQHVFTDTCDWECVVEGAAEVGDILGIDIRMDRLALPGNRHAYIPSVYFDLQNGASFDGCYRYAKGAARAIRIYAPLDVELHRIADELQAMQRKAFYDVRCRCRATRYNHLNVEVSRDTGRVISLTIQETCEDLMRDFAGWIYAQVRKEYEYQMSDEAIRDYMQCHDLTLPT